MLQLQSISVGGTPLVNATVLLNDAGSDAQLDSTASDASGLYSFTVNNGTYNLTIQASGYADSVVNGIAVAGADVTQNVVLVTPVSSTVSRKPPTQHPT